jgi:hypothetical protein
VAREHTTCARVITSPRAEVQASTTDVLSALCDEQRRSTHPQACLGFTPIRRVER